MIINGYWKKLFWGLDKYWGNNYWAERFTGPLHVRIQSDSEVTLIFRQISEVVLKDQRISEVTLVLLDDSKIGEE